MKPFHETTLRRSVLVFPVCKISFPSNFCFLHVQVMNSLTWYSCKGLLFCENTGGTYGRMLLDLLVKLWTLLKITKCSQMCLGLLFR